MHERSECLFSKAVVIEKEKESFWKKFGKIKILKKEKGDVLIILNY
jgi:hypothetical protein